MVGVFKKSFPTLRSKRYSPIFQIKRFAFDLRILTSSRGDLWVGYGGQIQFKSFSYINFHSSIYEHTFISTVDLSFVINQSSAFVQSVSGLRILHAYHNVFMIVFVMGKKSRPFFLFF